MQILYESCMYRHGVKFIAEINIFLYDYNMTCMFLSTFRSSELMYFFAVFLNVILY